MADRGPVLGYARRRCDRDAIPGIYRACSRVETRTYKVWCRTRALTLPSSDGNTSLPEWQTEPLRPHTLPFAVPAGSRRCSAGDATTSAREHCVVPCRLQYIVCPRAMAPRRDDTYTHRALTAYIHSLSHSRKCGLKEEGGRKKALGKWYDLYLYDGGAKCGVWSSIAIMRWILRAKIQVLLWLWL